MRIKRLFIGDFGIFRNQTLEDLGPGIVLVGGKNRAGKSTLMSLLRSLGSGFTKHKGLPPANIKYQVEADLIAEGDQDRTRIRIEGKSSPILTPPPGKSYTIEDLFPSELSYKHLYTISLDELMKRPEDLNNKELAQLQSLILGGGYQDIAHIIELEKDLSREAEAIGGKKGDPGVKDFKPHTQRIKEGIEERTQALLQLDDYNRTSNEREGLLEQKEKSLRDKEILEAELDILEALKNSYDDIALLKEKEGLLESHPGRQIAEDFPHEMLELVEDNYRAYSKLKEERDQAYYSIKGNFHKEADIPAAIGRIRDREASIREASSLLPAIKVRLENLEKLRASLRTSRQSLTDKLRGLGLANTKEEQDRIELLELNSITTEAELLNNANRLKSLLDQEKDLLGRRDSYLDEQERLKKEEQTRQVTSLAKAIRTFLSLSIVAIIIGFVLASQNPVLGILLGLFAIIGSALYPVLAFIKQKEARQRLEAIRLDLPIIEGKLERLETKIERVKSDKEAIEARLREINTALACSLDYDYLLTQRFYSSLVDLQASIRAIRTNEENYKKDFTSIRRDLSEIEALLDDLVQNGQKAQPHLDNRSVDSTSKGQMADNPIVSLEHDLDSLEELEGAHSKVSERLRGIVSLLEEVKDFVRKEEELFDQEDKLKRRMGIPIEITAPDKANELAIERLFIDYKEKARAKKDYLGLLREVKDLETNIRKAGSTARVVSAISLLGLDLEGEETDYLLSLFDNYIIAESLDKEYSEKKASLASKEKEITSLTESIQSATDKLNSLEENAQLESAHRKIDQARSDLWPLAYRYALLRTAAHICTKVKDSFLERMGDELLRPARQILESLTAGQYKGITPVDDFTQLDYSFSLADGTSQESVDILSRGTRDQVFLAVRLGRIKSLKPAPIIIDDSFVNFDSGHLTRALDLIYDLSQRQQIFIMTCHPHLVDQLARLGDSVQYWQLDQGSFSLSRPDRLIDHLKSS
ncbi:MAG: AAA family ATPase [Eubacteriales bacterium]